MEYRATLESGSLRDAVPQDTFFLGLEDLYSSRTMKKPVCGGVDGLATP
jgi:hypothetical protein